MLEVKQGSPLKLYLLPPLPLLRRPLTGRVEHIEVLDPVKLPCLLFKLLSKEDFCVGRVRFKLLNRLELDSVVIDLVNRDKSIVEFDTLSTDRLRVLLPVMTSLARDLIVVVCYCASEIKNNRTNIKI